MRDCTRWFHRDDWRCLFCWQAIRGVDLSCGGSFIPFPRWHTWMHLCDKCSCVDQFSTINQTELNIITMEPLLKTPSCGLICWWLRPPLHQRPHNFLDFIIFLHFAFTFPSRPSFPSAAAVTVLLQEPKRGNNLIESPLKAAKHQVESGGFAASLVANVAPSRDWEEVRIDSLSICVHPYCQWQWNLPRSFFDKQWQTSCLCCKSNLPLWGRPPAPTHYRVVNTSRLKH